MNGKRLLIYSIGHSDRSFGQLKRVLLAHCIRVLFDIRTVPRSRHNPQFDKTVLTEGLREAGIEYIHLKELGGLRKASKDSVNKGWRNLSFMGYADYMQTHEFDDGIKRLIDAAENDNVAIMCAEGNPHRCHRSLVADALLVRGVNVMHISSIKEGRLHRLTPFAKVNGKKITYLKE
jgi:uncharacterized protein (DUF488 family)